MGNIWLTTQSNGNISRVPMWYDESTRDEISHGPIVKCHVYTFSRVFYFNTWEYYIQYYT
jgi:hypothetical protein